MGRQRMSTSRLAITLMLLILLPSYTALAQDESSMVSQIEISDEGALFSEALMLTDGALSPDGENAMLVGEDGDVWLVPTSDATKGERITNQYTADLYAISWHPTGDSALIAGDDGTILRYSSLNSTFEKPPEAVNLYGESMRAVSWFASGQKAFVGGENGSVYSYSGNVLTKLETDWDSEISAITCHGSEDFCVVLSRQDGVGIIDRDGQFYWTGFVGKIWLDAVCPPGVGDRCVIIGAGRSIAVYQYDRADPENSYLLDFPNGVDVSSVTSFSGEFHSASLGANGQVLIHVVPYSIIEFSVMDMKSYAWLTNADAREASIELSATTPMFSWENRLRDGFIISSDGSISTMAGKQLSGDIFGIGLMILVAVSVPGVILGLIFMSSDRLQEKYKNWRRGRRETKLDIKGRPKQ